MVKIFTVEECEQYAGCDCPFKITNFDPNAKTSCGYPQPVLTSEDVPRIPDSPDAEIVDWDSYLRACNLDPETSNVPMLWHMPLTLYHLTQNIFLKYKECPETLIIHLLGVKGEALNLEELKSHFIDLVQLKNPDTKIKLFLFGPEVNPEHEVSMEDIQVKCGLWEFDSDNSPDLCIALNCGLGAFHTWWNPIRDIIHHGIPFLGTEYTHYSTNQNLKILHDCAPDGVDLKEFPHFDESSESYPIEGNPFAQPVGRGEGYSPYQGDQRNNNGYIFGVNVSDGGSGLVRRKFLSRQNAWALR